MRSLIDILELSTQEIDELMETAEDIIANPAKYSENAMGKSWLLCFLNLRPVHASALKLPCMN